MAYLEKKFDISQLENIEPITIDQFKDLYGTQFEKELNSLEEPEEQEEVDDAGLDGMFCGFAGHQAIRSAIQFEDVLKWWLIRLLWSSAMTPQEFIDLLAQLCCVEQALVKKLKIGAKMSGCLYNGQE